MDDGNQQGQHETEPELQRPDEAIKDLEPDEEESDAVKGGWYKVDSAYKY